MERKHNKLLTINAQELRKNMTRQEKHLWYDYLRTYPIRILRQKVVGDFIVDFYCAKAKIIIEVDGSQHYMEDGLLYDEKRTRILKTYGLEVFRFSNMDIDKKFTGICQMIDDEINKRVLYNIEE